jgi:hypothetical protein
VIEVLARSFGAYGVIGATLDGFWTVVSLISIPLVRTDELFAVTVVMYVIEMPSE